MTYNYKKILVKGYHREKPNYKYVKPYYRKQRFGSDSTLKIKKISHAKILTLQTKEKDWSHQSLRYPNIVGLNDKQIQDYIEKYPKEDQLGIITYLKYIRVFTPKDIKELSRELYHDFDTDMKEFNKKNPELILEHNKYDSNKTIFVTSPKGGFEILSQFAYSNFDNIHKRNLPYDLAEGKQFTDVVKKSLKADSLPYGNKIYDVNDIVFVDDIYMSGEQSGRALIEIKKKLETLNVDKSQYPRFHYIAIAGNNTYKTSSEKKEWEYDNGSFRVGKSYDFNFTYDDISESKKASAIVFPFSIPDGSRHRNARKLYRFTKRFPHRLD